LIISTILMSIVDHSSIQSGIGDTILAIEHGIGSHFMIHSIIHIIIHLIGGMIHIGGQEVITIHITEKMISLD